MAKREKESRALAPRKRVAEVVPRWDDVDRWFDRMAEEFWRRPFPSLFRRERWWPESALTFRTPSLDVYERNHEVVVAAELPGMTRDDVEVTLTGTTLTIRGEKKQEKEVEDRDYHRRERAWGAFVRSVELPCEVRTDEVKATFRDGVLEVRLPKTEEAKKKTVTVKVE